MKYLMACAASRYDSHREQILRAGRHQAGGDAGHEGQAPPEDISLFQYFSSSCYSGFNDGPMVHSSETCGSCDTWHAL